MKARYQRGNKAMKIKLTYFERKGRKENTLVLTAVDTGSKNTQEQDQIRT